MRHLSKLWLVLVLALCLAPFTQGAVAESPRGAMRSEGNCTPGESGWSTAHPWFCNCGGGTCREWTDELSQGTGYGQVCTLTGWHYLVYVVYSCETVTY